MPAIVDPEGPDGRPLSLFESGAILQYLGRKTGRFYGADERTRVDVDQWLFWQMGGLGPMAGQAHHFRQYAPAMLGDQRMLAYGVNRYTNEVARLYGVLDRRLQDREYVAGEYSIADMACWPWVVPHRNQGIDLADYPNVRSWFERVGERDGVRRGHGLGAELRQPLQASGKTAEEARRVLFGRR
jgi:glutathione S-transferase/GST-like protein